MLAVLRKGDLRLWKEVIFLRSPWNSVCASDSSTLRRCAYEHVLPQVGQPPPCGICHDVWMGRQCNDPKCKHRHMTREELLAVYSNTPSDAQPIQQQPAAVAHSGAGGSNIGGQGEASSRPSGKFDFTPPLRHGQQQLSAPQPCAGGMTLSQMFSGAPLLPNQGMTTLTITGKDTLQDENRRPLPPAPPSSSSSSSGSTTRGTRPPEGACFKFWEKGRCERPASCIYDHILPPEGSVPPMGICFAHWKRKGSCPGCEFRHETREELLAQFARPKPQTAQVTSLQQNPAAPQGSPAVPLRPEPPADSCFKFWKKGECSDGVQCAYVHRLPPHGASPPLGICFSHWISEGSCVVERCKYSHQSREQLMLSCKGKKAADDCAVGSAASEVAMQGNRLQHHDSGEGADGGERGRSVGVPGKGGGNGEDCGRAGVAHGGGCSAFSLSKKGTHDLSQQRRDRGLSLGGHNGSDSEEDEGGAQGSVEGADLLVQSSNAERRLQDEQGCDLAAWSKQRMGRGITDADRHVAWAQSLVKSVACVLPPEDRGKAGAVCKGVLRALAAAGGEGQELFPGAYEFEVGALAVR